MSNPIPNTPETIAEPTAPANSAASVPAPLKANNRTPKPPAKAEPKVPKTETKAEPKPTPAQPPTPPARTVIEAITDESIEEDEDDEGEEGEDEADPVEVTPSAGAVEASKLAGKMADVDVVDVQAVKAANACPAVGTKLRCPSFEGDTSVICIVEKTVPENGVFVVRIPALSDRLWPFSVERLVGDSLVYVQSDYPELGANAKFDEKYRGHLRGRTLTNQEQALIEMSGFSAPRRARPSHQWVKIVAGPVSAVCYDFDGKLAKGDHPMSKAPKASYVEMAKSTAKPLIDAGILLDCDTG